MLYLDLYYRLKEVFSGQGVLKNIPELNLEISHHEFISKEASSVLLGSNELRCKKHNLFFEEKFLLKKDCCLLDVSDSEVKSNIDFKYHIIRTISNDSSKGVILFFHGLNEKSWDKYLPWAYGLAKKTGKVVVLFPIAFHMDRAPDFWSDHREMAKIATKRAEEDIENSDCSFVNAAISSRMEEHPQRMFWSGLQTYYDIENFIQSVKSGAISQIDKNASIDLFGYSIGAFFSMMLLMSNPNRYFNNSKLFCFCGGITIDRMFPISKYIMDGKATVAMQEFFSLLLSSDFVKDKRLKHYQDVGGHFEESWFKTLLKYNYFQERREGRLKELEQRIKAFVLKKDKVIPAIEALNTLKGGYRDINIEVQIEDFNHPYSHVMPFPLTNKNSKEIDDSYMVFVNAASKFLK